MLRASARPATRHRRSGSSDGMFNSSMENLSPHEVAERPSHSPARKRKTSFPLRESKHATPTSSLASRLADKAGTNVLRERRRISFVIEQASGGLAAALLLAGCADSLSSQSEIGELMMNGSVDMLSAKVRNATIPYNSLV